jgi:hypothetical protein
VGMASTNVSSQRIFRILFGILLGFLHGHLHQYSCRASQFLEVAQLEKPLRTSENLETQTLGNRRSIFPETCLDSPGRKFMKLRKPTETYITLELCSYVLVDSLSRVV